MKDATETVTPEKTAAEIYVPLLQMIRIIRSRRDISIAETIQRYGGPGILREYRKCVTEMDAELGGES